MALPAYPDWLSHRIAARRALYPEPAAAGLFSLLTAAWNSSPALLEETARSILGQEGAAGVQWVIVDNGSDSADTRDALARLERHPAVCVVRPGRNLGIVGGLRLALESASGRYVLPVDHDDTLAPDCLRVLAATIARHGEPALVFSDEDVLVDGRPRSPYRRPSFDPVLNLASSYVWHAVAVRRDVALARGLFADPGAEYCQDWDTLMRIGRGGERIVHVPEVLYHWRHHPASSTGRSDPAQGSLRSVRHVLEQAVAEQPHPGRYRVEDFPLFRGARELHVRRLETDPPPLDVLIVGGRGARVAALAESIALTWNHPLRDLSVWWNAAQEDVERRDLRHSLATVASLGAITGEVRLFAGVPLGTVLQSLAAPACMVVSDGLLASGRTAPWEAALHFEWFPDLAVMSGRTLDASGTVRDSGWAARPDGSPHALFAGLAAGDPGPYALALKPHCVDAPSLDAFFARRDFLLANAGDLPAGSTTADIAARLASGARGGARRIAMSPLIRFALQEGVRCHADAGALPGWRLPLPPPEAPIVSEMGFVLARAWHAD